MNPDTSSCIANYIEEKLGCNPRILGSSKWSKKYCNSTSELKSLANITNEFTKFNANKFRDITGCLALCEKDEYDTIDGPLTEGYSKMARDFHLQFNIASGSLEEKEQYLIYDLDSFIADIGGFLGLLLGWSVLSLYNEMADLVVRFKTAVCRN